MKGDIVDCVQQVRHLQDEHWQTEEMACGGSWLEILWRRGEQEHELMMVYGEDNVDAVSQCVISARIH